MKGQQPDVALAAGADLGEGPWWDIERNELLWVDIFSGDVHFFSPAAGTDRCVTLGQPVGMVARRTNGGLVCAVRDGVGFIDEHGELELVRQIEADAPGNRMNDGAVDPRGNLWAGTMASDLSPSAGALYRVEPGLAVETVLGGVSISNGLDWSPDGRAFYYTDSTTRRIDVFDVDPDTGQVRSRRPFIELSDRLATPDGLAVDAEGTLWVAMWDGGCVRQFSPDGRLLRTIELPVTRVTSVAFGGPGLDQLFITSARHGLSAAQLSEQPQAGSIFLIETAVPGLPPHRFAG